MLAVLVTGVPKRFGLIHDGGILTSCHLEGAPWGAVRRYPVRRHTSTDICDIIPSIYYSKCHIPEARRDSLRSAPRKRPLWIQYVDPKMF